MKLSAYIITVDAGFAPNPFSRYCTLACCKPSIRRNAEKDDIIAALASTNLPKPGHLIYAMRVKWILPYRKYWSSQKFAGRKPSPKTAISRRGDNVWHQEKGQWRVVPGAFHDESHRDSDISGENVLVSTEFFYFGSDAVRVPDRFVPLFPTTQGHKNTRDPKIVNQFWRWVSGKRSRPGRWGDPCAFTDDACRTQCGEVTVDDPEEV